TPGAPGGDGIYRITHDQLAALGVDLADVRFDDLRLMSRGPEILGCAAVPKAIEIPLDVHDADGDGLFGPADWFQFWGQALVGESCEFYFQGADYTDANVYLLDTLPGMRRRMIVRDASPISPVASEALDTAHAEVNDLFVNNT